ncbi:hypothetical protein [Marivirga harenae]|uniref:hypothetical protein n=1 Tax=Marivirga harenae TaxID=2010992 RepID=UPI0026DEF9E3|nr:hypothetical protein [Marivirga harenae]WKV13011.1 hypothetical protein Q3Y49_04115 [Marivirga harenae]|tara:strand:+ start:137355 stop:138782 length:1428 start_codon:yes stop_codon:yes gene_type:complete
MKTLSTVVFLGAIFLCSCSPEKENLKGEEVGKVHFNLSLSNENGQAREVLAIPAGSYVQISIETVNGENILEDETLEILSFNGNFVSKPLQLNTGEYNLTKFLLISPDNEVLYATPISGSTKADLVKNPLPLNFEVDGANSTQLKIEVINVSMLNPRDIGYISFPFTVTDFFFLSVFKLSEKGSELTHAKGLIIQNEDTIKRFTVKPEINSVGISNIGDEEFSLVLIKKGFAMYSETFTIESLFDKYENGLINIHLDPALTFIALPQLLYSANFEFSLSYVGEITIDWGDGHTETRISTDYSENFSHNFGSNWEYFVSVSGDVDKITDFYSYYGQGPIKEINLFNLPNLESFRNGFNGEGMSPEILDFSHNPNLTFINISASASLQKIILKDNNAVEFLLLSYGNQISTSSLEEIINPIYNSVIASGRMNGGISLENFPDDPEPTVGPPSADTWQKLSVLENDFNWSISTVFEYE